MFDCEASTSARRTGKEGTGQSSDVQPARQISAVASAQDNAAQDWKVALMTGMVLRCFGATSVVLAWLVFVSTSARADKEVQALAVATGVVIATTIGMPIPAESDQLAFEGGRLDPVKNVQPATAFGVEFRSGQMLLWRLRPFIGAGFTTDHSFYGYGGIRIGAHWGDHVVVTPSFAVGGYSRGDGKELGSPAIIGRFGIDLEYRFDSDVRVGIGYHHMSNGKVFGQESNPGTEVVGLTLSIPLQ